MAGLLDTLVRKNAEEARAKQLADGSLSTVPPAPPTLGEVQPAPRAISQDDAALANAGPGALGVAAGVEQTSGVLKNAVAAAAQAVSQPELAANVRKSAIANEEEGARISGFSSAPQTLKDALETGDIGNYLIGGVARNVPQLGVMGAGALLTRGRALGVAAPSAAMNAGDVYGEGQGEIDKLVAAGQLDPAREQQMRHQVLVNTGIAAPIMAALDTYGFSKIFGTPALKAGAAKVIADSLPAHVRKALLAEGGTEAVQEYIGLTANKLALERPEAFGLTKDDVWRLADAGVLGAAAGGTFAVPGHIAAPLARAAGQTVDAGIDAATAFMRPEEPTPGAAGGGSPPSAGPSAGTRAGDFMRAVVDLDAPAVQKFAQDAFDAAMNNEAVQNAAKQGGDFWSAFSKGKRFARAEAFWDQHAPEVEAGFNQFVAGIGDTAQTGDMKAMFERYKEALARTMPGMPDIDIDRTDVDVAARGAGRKIGDAIAGFNTAAARTPGFVDGIVNGAKKQAAAAAGVMNDAAASAKSAVESGVQSAVDGMENLSGNIREFGERLDAGNRTSQVDPASFATGNTYEPDDSPLDASQAKRVAQSLLTRIRPEQPPGKQSVVMSNDAKAIARTLADHAPGLRNTDFLNMLARGFEGLVNNPALFKSKLYDPQIATTIRMLFNLRPAELARSLMSDLRAGKEPSTQNDALSYVGDPNYATDAVLASEAKRVEDTGATVDGEVIADTETGEIKDAPERAPVEESNLDPTLPGVRERETFKKMIATPEQKEAAAKGRQKGMQWVIVTETVRDPDTDEVIKQTSRPGQVNLMNMARSQAGERRAVEGATTQQRSDTNFLESVGALFNGWTETNAAGQPVEYRVQPAAQRENGGELTAVPRDGLEGWLRDNSLIGFAKDKDGNAVPRTFGQLEQSGVSSVTVTKNEIPSFAEQAAKFLDKAPTYDEQMAEAKSKEWRERIEKRRAAHASSLAKSAAYFIRKVQGPEERVRDVVAATMDFTDSVPDAAVDEMWDGLETGTIENRDQVLAAIQEASERNDIAPLRGIVPDVYAALSARRSSALMSVQLLSSEMREGWTGSGDAKIEAVLQDHLIEKYEQAPKDERDPTNRDPSERADDSAIYSPQGDADFATAARAAADRFAGSGDAGPRRGGDVARTVQVNTISGKAGTLAQDEEGVITEDLAGAYIDHGAAVDRAIAGKRKAEAEEKRAAKAKQSVVKQRREEAAMQDEPDTAPFKYARYAPNGYEVSSAGDARFSALNARLKDGRTIEEAYQLDVKGYRKDSNNWRAGKGKPPLDPTTDVWAEYKKLWQQWAAENPLLIEQLRKHARGRVLTDKFASSPVSQARALAEILNETALRPREDSDLTNDERADSTAGMSDEEFDAQMAANRPDFSLSTASGGVGYRQRTIENAQAADVTLAFALDYNTPGEKLTRTAAAGKFAAVPYGSDVQQAAAKVAAAIKKFGPNLNIAGNGMQTLAKSGVKQSAANAWLTDVLRAAHAQAPIASIRSGGQTGIDLAGAVAGMALGIPVHVHMPAGYLYRLADGVDRKADPVKYEKYIRDEANKLAEAAKLDVQTAAPEVAAKSPKGQAPSGLQTEPNRAAGDIWDMPGVKVVTTNLGGVHGRGLAKQAKLKGLIGPRNRDVDSSPKTGGVITLAVKGWAPETARVPGQAFSEQTAGKNIDLLRSEVGKLVALARANPGTRYNLPYAGLGFGEGDPKVILPILEQAAREPNIFLVGRGDEVQTRYADTLKPGVRRDASSRASRANTTGDLDLTTPEGREAARKAIEEIAGKLHIKFGTEDSYDWQGHVITLAARKDGSLTTAYHEALHAVFKAIATEDKATLYAALNAPHVRKQLRELLKDSPEAIQDMINDSEELAAYAFQFWKMGMLDLNPGAKNWFGKIVELIEKSLAWLKDQPTAEELLNRIADGYYKNGGPNPAEVAFLKSQRAHHALRSVTGMVTRGMLSLYDTLLTPMDDRLRETGIGELHEIARLLYTQVGEEGMQRGLAQAVPAMTKKFLNEFGNIIHGDPAGTIAALRAIASGTDDRTDPRVVKIRSFLNKMHRYMTDAGVKVGYIEDYLPMQWSGDLIADDEEGFIALMSKYRKELKQINEDLTPRLAWQMMSQRNLSRAIPTGDVFDEHGVPTAHHAQERIFSFLSNAEREPYTEPDLIGTMSQYIKQSVKRAEHSRRFGAQNEVLKKLLIDAKDRGATTEQISLVEDYIDAIHGAKFAKMDPNARKIVGAVQTYQNFRVLGLAIFSSVVDPLVLAVRSGEFKEAWGAYKNVVTSILGTRNPQELQQLGEDIGAIEARGIEDAVLGLYGGFEVEGDLKKLNDLFFTYNGMNGLTKSLRVYALGAGQRFIAKHARGGDPRMLRELGLERDDVHFMPDGSLAVRGTQYRELGLDPMEALKIQNALNRFVDESVLHPNAGERPGWGNDPLWGLLFHLKQFIFSFHKTVSKKVAHELESGNPSAALHAAAFIPIMAASGFMREAIQTAGNIPADHGFLYYLGYGAQRSGFMGPSALASDAGHSLMSGMNPLGAVGGPTADQLLDAAGVLAHPERFGDFVEEALPLSSIYKRW